MFPRSLSLLATLAVLAVLSAPGGTTLAADVSDRADLLADFDAPFEDSVVLPVGRSEDHDAVIPPKAKKPPARKAKGARGVPPAKVDVPAGCFAMGAPDSVGSDNSRPRHEVCLSAFSLDRIPVTQREYALEAGRAPWELCEGYTCTPPNPDHPAWFVTWFEADSFCRARGGRLPTESEYEYAARAGDSGLYIWGDSLKDACDHANIADLTLLKLSKNWRTFPCTDRSALVDVAGTRKPNRWGLHDMTGNVWAWTADWYSGTAYTDNPKQDPTGPAKGTGRVIRGGSWITGPDGAYISYRDGLAPNLRYFGAIGFRCAYPSATPSLSSP